MNDINTAKEELMSIAREYDEGNYDQKLKAIRKMRRFSNKRSNPVLVRVCAKQLVEDLENHIVSYG